MKLNDWMQRNHSKLSKLQERSQPFQTPSQSWVLSRLHLKFAAKFYAIALSWCTIINHCIQLYSHVFTKLWLMIFPHYSWWNMVNMDACHDHMNQYESWIIAFCSSFVLAWIRRSSRVTSTKWHRSCWSSVFPKLPVSRSGTNQLCQGALSPLCDIVLGSSLWRKLIFWKKMWLMDFLIEKRAVYPGEMSGRRWKEWEQENSARKQPELLGVVVALRCPMVSCQWRWWRKWKEKLRCSRLDEEGSLTVEKRSWWFL